MRTAATSALVVPLAAVLVACAGTAATTAPTPGPVRIGAIYNLTGDQSSLDAPSLDGARLAVDRINANGGLLGRRVELLERDGQTDEAGVRRAAASLVASGCSAIVGLSDTDQVLAAAPIAASAGVPFVTSGATSPRLPKQVPNWLFLACFGDNAQAAASAQFATDQLGARTAAIVYGKDLEYTRLLAKYFERSFRAQGGKVVATTDFTRPSQVVRRLKTAGASDRTSGSSGSGDGSAAGDNGSASSGDASSGSSGGEGAGSGAGSSSEPSSGSSTGSEGTATTTATATPSITASAVTTATPAAASADVLYVAAGPSDAAAIVRRLRAAGYRQPIMGGDSFDSTRADPGRGGDRRQGLLHDPRRRGHELGEPGGAPLRRVVPGRLRPAAAERVRLLSATTPWTWSRRRSGAPTRSSRPRSATPSRRRATSPASPGRSATTARTGCRARR